jgi:biopolymer transport protein ExbB
VIETLMAGGPVMIPIGLCSVVALAVFVERLWSLRRQHTLPRSLADGIVARIASEQWDEARALCRTRDIAVTRLAMVAIESRQLSRAGLKERLEEVGRREAALLERGTPVIGTIASITPLLGLLGTVGGMIRTFAIIQTAGMGDVGSLAGGISEALITTFAGLSVGIPAVVANRYLLSRVDALLVDLEDIALDLVDATVGEDVETAQ